MTNESLQRAKEIKEQLPKLKIDKEHFEAAIEDYETKNSFEFTVKHEYRPKSNMDCGYTAIDESTEHIPEKSRTVIGALYLSFCMNVLNVIKREIEALEKEFDNL